MAVQCDCAAHPEFALIQLFPGLAGLECPACTSLLLDLNEYRRWQHRFGQMSPASVVGEQGDTLPETGHEPLRARCCPGCQGIMSRYRVANTPAFRLDFCSRCELVWFDAGEWQLMEKLGLIPVLPQVLSEDWQRRLQTEALAEMRRKSLEQRLGHEVLTELRRIQSWLKEQPNRSELLHLLQGEPL